MSVITVIGAGMMGSALSIPACDNRNLNTVRIVGTPLDDSIIDRLREDRYHLNMKRYLPENAEFYKYSELSDLLPGSDLFISGVSSFGVKWFSENIIPILPPEIPILSVTKGLFKSSTDGSGKLITAPEYYAENDKCKTRNICAVGGPCTSYELADKNQTIVCFCGKSISILEKIRDMLSTSYYHIELSEDVRGVECAVAMKNAYALGVSLGIGIPESIHGESCTPEYNFQAALFLQSVREMERILACLGGKKESLYYGIGDLYVTIFGGRTRKIGTLLGRGVPYEQAREMLNGVTLESISITNNFCESAENSGIDMEKLPLLRHIYNIINNGSEAKIPFDSFC